MLKRSRYELRYPVFFQEQSMAAMFTYDHFLFEFTFASSVLGPTLSAVSVMVSDGWLY